MDVMIGRGGDLYTGMVIIGRGDDLWFSKMPIGRGGDLRIGRQSTCRFWQKKKKETVTLSVTSPGSHVVREKPPGRRGARGHLLHGAVGQETGRRKGFERRLSCVTDLLPMA